jgi:predicted RND superfamily exporter protein
MSPYISKLFGFTNRHPGFLLAFDLLVMVVFLAQLPHLRTATNTDYFMVQNDDTKFHNLLKKTFGNDDFLVIALHKDAIFTAENLQLIRTLTEELEAPEVVRRVISLSNVEDIRGTSDAFEVAKLYTEAPISPHELEALRERVLNDPMYRVNLISADGKTASIVVFGHFRPDDDSYRAAFVSAIETIVNTYRKQGHELYIAGVPATNVELSRVMMRDMAIFMPLTYIMMALIIFVVYRRANYLMLALANICAALICTVGLFPLLSINFNNMTGVAVVVALVLSLADTNHVLSSLDRKTYDRHGSAAAALTEILTAVVLPCLLTSVTTAIGFLSLALSSLQSLREFALISSAAMLFEFFFTFFLIPPLILLFCRPENIFIAQHAHTGFTFGRPLARIFSFVERRPRHVLAAAALLAMLGAVLTFRVKVQTNIFNFFKPSSAHHQAVDFVQQHLGGIVTVDISVKAHSLDELKEPKNLLLMDRLQRELAALPEIDSVLSFNNFLKEMNKSFHAEEAGFYAIPTNRNAVEQYLLLYDGEDLRDYMTSSYDHARITCRTSANDSHSEELLIDQIRALTAKIFAGSALDVRVSGSALNFVNTAHELVSGQISSFGTAALIIGVLMIVTLHSVELGCISLIPNLFPVFLNFGVMGLLGFPLDTGTIMIASIALGIAVDDTIHFLSAYQKNCKRQPARSIALKRAFEQKGRAAVTTSVTFIFGFSILMCGNFVPVVSFGFLTCVVMIVALLADLYLLPALLLTLLPDKTDNRNSGSSIAMVRDAADLVPADDPS